MEFEGENLTNRVGANWPYCSRLTVSHDAEQANNKLVPFDLTSRAAGLIAMAVPATMNKRSSLTRQRLTQRFKTPAYYNTTHTYNVC